MWWRRLISMKLSTTVALLISIVLFLNGCAITRPIFFKEVVKKNQEIEVKILEVSSEERKLALGVKQLEDDPWESISSDFTTGKKVKGIVIRVLDKGIIFDLGNNIEGIVPMKRIPKTLRSKVRAE